jgi:prolyl oligopeptidase
MKHRTMIAAGMAALAGLAPFATPLATSAFAGEGTPPPPTKVDPVEDTLHGVKFVDKFRWLEGDNSDAKNMGKATPEVEAWTTAQNAYTRSVLDSLPGRKALEEKMRPLMEIGTVSAPGMRGDRYFFSKREGTQNQAVLYYRDGYKGETKTLLDPAVLDPTGLTTVSASIPSEDGKLLAYGTYRKGDEATTMYVMDIATGKLLPDVIPGKVDGVDWLPDGSGFFYRNLWDVSNPYAGQYMFHKLGDKVENDKQLFRQYKPEENAKLATTWGPGGALSRDGKWILKSYSTSTKANDLWFGKAEEFFKTGKVTWTTISEGADARFVADFAGDTMFLQTDDGNAPNGQVYAVDLNNAAKDKWKLIIPTRKDVVITGVGVAKGILAVTTMVNATSRIELYDFAGKSLGNLRLPQEIGTAGLSIRDDRTEAYLSFSSYNYPTTIFRVDLAKPTAEPELWERPAVPVDPATVEVKQEWYSSKDGTRVPMFIIHKKGLKLDGNAPTVLYGYGGFNISMTPGFSATLFPWFEAGGVYAVANLRGGGEFGEAWHRSGMLESKQNVFNDCIAAGEYLVEKGYTNPNRLAVSGGSNGGLLVGAMVVQRPDLFRAAICAVPLLDMLRYQDFLMARYWVPEYGSAEDKVQFETLKAYSPYQNIKAGTKYPAVLITAGEHDSRVHPLHARKMAAALREATTSGHPILYWGDTEAGHGQGKPLNLRLRDAVDQRIFLMWQLGMQPK